MKTTKLEIEEEMISLVARHKVQPLTPLEKLKVLWRFDDNDIIPLSDDLIEIVSPNYKDAAINLETI